MAISDKKMLPLVLGAAAVAGLIAFVATRPRGPGAGAAGAAEPQGASAAVIVALEAKRRKADADLVRAACAAAAADSCECRQEAALRALNRDLHAEALGVIMGADAACRGQGKTAGMEAEALARAGQLGPAAAKATEVLQGDANNPFATYALGQSAYMNGDLAGADGLFRQAVARGRGAPAHLILGLMAFRKNDFDGARAEFGKMLESDPEDVDAHYNLAVVAGAQNRYRDAREGYLGVLRRDPAHADARYNLALLTHSAGATQEAQHHLAELEKITKPDDPRVAQLKAVLGTTAAAPGAGTQPPGVVTGRVEGSAAPAVSAP